MLCTPIRGSFIARSIRRLTRPGPSTQFDRKESFLVAIRHFSVTMSNNAENRSYSVSTRIASPDQEKPKLTRCFGLDRKLSSCSILVNRMPLRESLKMTAYPDPF